MKLLCQGPPKIEYDYLSESPARTEPNDSPLRSMTRVTPFKRITSATS